MITREEALYQHENNGDLLAEYQDIINEIFDQHEQHIKYLESQLSRNPLQLTCDSCKYEHKENCLKGILPNRYHTFEFCCNKYTSKGNR